MQVPTRGLLNVVAAPHLAVASTYTALTPKLPRPQRDQVCVFTSPNTQTQATNPPRPVLSSLERGNHHNSGRSIVDKQRHNAGVGNLCIVMLLMTHALSGSRFERGCPSD